MTSDRDRTELLGRLAAAGREFSDAAVMFHTALADRLELSASEWKTLGLLDQHGPLTAGDLADRSGLAPPSITGILDRLERNGWIRRDRDAADRRRVVVHLNEQASSDRFADAFAGLQRRLEELYSGYNKEELAFVADAMFAMAAQQRRATADLQGTRAQSGSGGDPVSNS